MSKKRLYWQIGLRVLTLGALRHSDLMTRSSSELGKRRVLNFSDSTDYMISCVKSTLQCRVHGGGLLCNLNSEQVLHTGLNHHVWLRPDLQSALRRLVKLD